MDPEKAQSVTKASTPPVVDSATNSTYLIDRVYNLTKCGLFGRHVQFMAVGGSIGTGLFVGIGSALRSSGSLSAALAYIIYCLTFIYPYNTAVGEMTTYLPTRGSIFESAKR